MDEPHNQLSEADQRVVAMAEAEIGRALLVEPSPEFQAKVRARIAAQPRRTLGSHPWFALAVAASILVAVAALVVFERRSADGRPELSAGRPGLSAPATEPVASHADREPVTGIAPLTEGPAHSSSPGLSPRPARRAAAAQRLSARAAIGRSAADVTAEVLIDPAQQVAIKRLFAMTQRGVKLPEGADKEIAVPAELAVSPIVVEPLQVPAIPAEPAPGSSSK